MPRTYKKRIDARSYKSYTDETLCQCLLAIENKEITQRKAEQTYGIPRRTIINRLRARRQQKEVPRPGFPQIFSQVEEQRFSECVELLGIYGFPVSSYELRLIVKSYLDKIGRRVKVFKNNLPGREWVNNFLSRHTNLSQRFAANIKRNRAAVDAEVLREFIKNLKREVEDVPPSNIWNFDETNVTDDPGNKKVIVKRGTKYPELIRNSSKSSISLMFCGNAAGELLPCYVVYKSTCLWTTWTENGPSGARYNCSPSGWFDMNIFTDWFESLFLPTLKKQPGKKIIIGDNLSSHISLDVINLCKENNIVFLCLPPNSTHLCQPLDVAFFHPLKVTWRSLLSEWKASECAKDAILPKGIFPQLLNRLITTITPNVRENLISGFRKSGIYPADVQPLLDRLPKPQSVNLDAIQSSFVESLESKRTSWTKNISNKGRRKLNLIPGKSVAEQVEPSTSTRNLEESHPGQHSKKKTYSKSTDESSDKISLRESSTSPLSELENEDPTNLEFSLDLKPLKRKVGQYVIFRYEGELFPGIITNVQEKGPTISAMTRSIKNWKWPNVKDEIDYEWDDVLGCINTPKKIGRRDFYYVPELDNIWSA